MSGVTVRFGDVIPVCDIDLRVEQGEQVVLLGPSGAGKSTLLNLAAGRVSPTSGEVVAFGRRWSDLRPGPARVLRRRVAVIHQQLDLVPVLRVVHNVNAGRLGSWSTARTLRSLVRPVEVDEARRSLEAFGLDDRLMERTDRLSGGEQQRVAVARALRQRADLTLADEPISAVDPTWRQRVLDLLVADAATRGATLVVSSHDTALALERVPRAIGIKAGRIVFDQLSSTLQTEQLDDLYGAVTR